MRFIEERIIEEPWTIVAADVMGSLAITLTVIKKITGKNGGSRVI